MAESDPEPTLAGSKSRSAAVSRHTVVCYPLGRKPPRRRLAALHLDSVSLGACLIEKTSSVVLVQ